MGSNNMEAINLKISYVDKQYPFAANPFAVLCLDSNERLYRDEYCVFYGNTESPNKEIRFIREDDYEEAFSIVLDALPIEIEHIVVIVSGVDRYPSELVFEFRDDIRDYVKKMYIPVNMSIENVSFLVAKIIRNQNKWIYSIETEMISQDYIDQITQSR